MIRIDFRNPRGLPHAPSDHVTHDYASRDVFGNSVTTLVHRGSRSCRPRHDGLSSFISCNCRSGTIPSVRTDSTRPRSNTKIVGPTCGGMFCDMPNHFDHPHSTETVVVTVHAHRDNAFQHVERRARQQWNRICTQHAHGVHDDGLQLAYTSTHPARADHLEYRFEGTLVLCADLP